MNVKINLDELEAVTSDYMFYMNQFWKQRAKLYRKHECVFLPMHRNRNDDIYRAYELMETYERMLKSVCDVCGINFDSVVAAQRTINKYYNGKRFGDVRMGNMTSMIRFV